MAGSLLYAWQAEALDSWTRAGRAGIVEAVTGTGKTRVGQAAIEDAIESGRRAVVLVPTKELQRQWHTTLRRALPGRVRIGLLGDGNHDRLHDHEILVSIVDSARLHGIDVPRGSLLVADECHRYASPESQRALVVDYERRLGLTATLERPDRAEQALLNYFGPVCYRIGYARALSDAVVAQFSLTLIGVPMAPHEAVRYESVSRRISDLFKELTRVHGLPASPFHVFMRAVKEAAEESSWSPAQTSARAFLSAVFDRKNLMANSDSKFATALELAPAIASADRTLVFTESKQVAEDLAAALRSMHLTAAAIHSDLPGARRREVFQRFSSGRLQVIVAPRVLDEGVDVPAADLAIIVSASKTRRQMIQRMGRVLRRKDDDRLARIAILYLEGTTEDPAGGAHEAFLSEVTSVAEDLDDFRSDRLEDALEFLCVTEPISPPLKPRMQGDPPRPLAAEADDEDVPAEEFFGLSSPIGAAGAMSSRSARSPR